MYVQDILNSFKKKYGDQWLERYFAWQNANKGQAQKALNTAQKRGDKIVKTLAKTKAGKAKAKANG